MLTPTLLCLVDRWGVPAVAERRIETAIDINAPPKVVWTLLTDFAGMPSWNPFIQSISGELQTGSRLSVHIAPPGKVGMRFKPAVIAVRPNVN